MIQFLAKNTTKNDTVFFGNYLHIGKPKSHGLQKFENVVRMNEIKIALLIYLTLN